MFAALYALNGKIKTAFDKVMKISVSKSEDITPANRFSAFKSILENKYKSQNEHTAERITRAKDETDITLVQGKWLSVRERNVLCKIN